MELHWMLCTSFLLLSATTQALNISVNLTDGPVPYAGRVQVNINGTWGSICDTGLNLDVGHVICRQLGYPQAIATPCCDAFGPSPSPFWLTGVKCNGNESSLDECEYKDWGENLCFRGLDVASVVCAEPNITTSYPLKVRLSHFSVQYAGCVEVEYAGIWGDVGQFSWDQADGRVVCRQLGYQDVLTVMWRCRSSIAVTGRNVVTWLDNVQCIGNETYLTNCSHDLQTYRSSFGIDAGVVCKNTSQTDLRISLDGAQVTYAGRVEVFLAGKWGAIDRITWHFNDAHVACKQLGFSGAELAVRGATYIFNPKWSKYAMNIQWLENVQCVGNESSLNECPHSVSFTPGPVLEAGAVCTSDKSVRKIRLTGGNVSYAGRVEVYVAGVWGTIRNRGWNMSSSNVACRQLGYPGADSAILSTVGPFGIGEGPVWISDLKCKGDEESLWECSWPRIAGIYWDHDNDAGVICKPASTTTNSPSAGKTEDKSSLSQDKALKIGLPVACGAILLILVLAFYFRCYRKQRGEHVFRRDFVNMSEVNLSTDTGQTNPAFERVDTASRIKLDLEDKDEIDWCEITRERLSVGEKIGTESGGVTFHGKLCLENGNMVNCIVKAAKESTLEEKGSLDEVNELLAELKIMSCLGSHPNILNLFGACTLKGPTYLVFEEAEQGNLLDYLQRHQTNDETNSTQKVCTLSTLQKLSIALDVAKGMKHIADKKCTHKDLAARNVRLGNNGVAKVTNIDCSRDIYDRTFYEDVSSGKLTAAKWMALETLESMKFSPESDVWSFGVLLWEIETGGAVPYPEIEAKDLLQSLKSGHRMEKPEKTSNTIYELMTKCWLESPHDRPKFSELCMVLETLVERETTC